MGCLLFGTAMLAGHVEAVDLRKMTEYAIDVFLRGIRNDSPPAMGPFCLLESQQS